MTLEKLWPLRLALHTLLHHTPLHLLDDNVSKALSALRDRLEEQEMAEIRRLGPQEYLLIKPLRPDAGGDLAEKVAAHVRALDDLGLVLMIPD
jgi:hypothetical protein